MDRFANLLTLTLGLSVVTALSTVTIAQEILKSDPPAGSLFTGTSVLVDDGSCPPGNIKKLTRVGPMDGRGYRKRECVPYKKRGQ